MVFDTTRFAVTESVDVRKWTDDVLIPLGPEPEEGCRDGKGDVARHEAQSLAQRTRVPERGDLGCVEGVVGEESDSFAEGTKEGERQVCGAKEEVGMLSVDGSRLK